MFSHYVGQTPILLSVIRHQYCFEIFREFSWLFMKLWGLSRSRETVILSLRKKCPYLELFWSAFFLIRTEYGEIWSYSGPHFPAFGLNTERYSASLLIQSECGKMRTKVTPNRDTYHAVHFCDESNSERRSMKLCTCALPMGLNYSLWLLGVLKPYRIVSYVL